MATTGGDDSIPRDELSSPIGPGDSPMMHVTIISPTVAAFDGAATFVRAPAHDGHMGILYGHAPMVVLLGKGDLLVRVQDEDHLFRVAHGFLQVLDNNISVLAEEVEVVGGP